MKSSAQLMKWSAVEQDLDHDANTKHESLPLEYRTSLRATTA